MVTPQHLPPPPRPPQYRPHLQPRAQLLVSMVTPLHLTAHHLTHLQLRTQLSVSMVTPQLQPRRCATTTTRSSVTIVVCQTIAIHFLSSLRLRMLTPVSESVSQTSHAWGPNTILCRLPVCCLIISRTSATILSTRGTRV